MVERERLRRGGHHSHPHPDVGMLTQAERTNGENFSVWLSENLKSGMRQCIGDDADLDVDRLIFHKADQMLNLFASMRSAFSEPAFGQIEPSGQAVLQKSSELGSRKKINDSRSSLGVSFFALGENSHDLRHVRKRAFAIVHGVWNAFAQYAGEPLMKS